MRLPLALGALLLLAGCASGGSSPSIGSRDRTIVGGIDARSRDGAAMITTQGTGTIDTPVAATWEQLRPAIRRAYETVGIEVKHEDPRKREIGNLDFWKQRSLQNQRLSRFVSCGTGFTGPNADSFRVYFSVVTTVTPAEGGGSVLRTAVVATAADIASGSPDRVVCETTGALEALIARNVKAGLAAQ